MDQLPLVDWFGNPIEMEQQAPLHINPCVALYGPEPQGRTCEQCRHLIGICHARTYYKCLLRGVTNGPKTDHRMRWQACAKFEDRGITPIPLYDGRS